MDTNSPLQHTGDGSVKEEETINQLPISISQSSMKRKITQIAYLTVLGAMMFIGISACKKSSPAEISDSEHIQTAKQWYERDQKGLATMMQSAKGQVAALSFNPDWEKANVEIVDGKAIIAAPVTTNLQNVMGKQTEYSLVISNDNGRFASKIVSVNNLANNNTHLDAGELYQAAFNSANFKTDEPLYAGIRVYDRGFKLDGETLYKGNTRETVNEKAITLAEAVNMQKQQLTEVKFCTEWFLITYEYDDYGNVYNIREQSLGKSCQTYYEETIDYIANDDPSSANPLAMAVGSQNAANDSVGTATTEYETAEERTKTYSWVMLEGITWPWTLKSHERGVHKKENGTWRWHSLSHINYTSQNKPSWLYLDVTPISAIPTVTASVAYMDVKFNLNSYILFEGSPLGPGNDDHEYRSPRWGVSF